ncbi:hypothetical protein Q3304_08685 [Clostridioides sp. GD02377]|uniref:hypothetical protein n=1 Tax=unclassified Clostridioides TaxID=2635829 RepID=UPI0038AF3B43
MLKLKGIDIFFHDWKISNDFKWGTITFKLKKGFFKEINSKVVKIQNLEDYTYISIDTFILNNVSDEQIYGGALESIFKCVLESVQDDKLIFVNKCINSEHSNNQDIYDNDDEFDYDEYDDDDEYDFDDDEYDDDEFDDD